MTNPYQAPSTDLRGRNSAANDHVAPSVMGEMTGTRPWVRFIAILGFIAAGVSFLSSTVATVLFVKQLGVIGLVMGLLSFVYGLIYFYPALKLWKYGSAIAQLQRNQSASDLEQAIKQQRVFWKFTGIFIIVMIALSVAMCVAMVFFGAAAFHLDSPFGEDLKEIPDQPDFNFDDFQ